MENDFEKENTESSKKDTFPKDNLADDDFHPDEADRNSNLNESGQDSIDKWVKEISENTPEEDMQDEDLDDLSAKEDDLPEWIDTLTQPDSESSMDEGEEEETLDSDEPPSPDNAWEAELSIDSVEAEDQQASIEKNNQPNEEFIEISDYDMTPDETPTEESSLEAETDKEQEELPEWLEEMIAEPIEEPSSEVVETAVDDQTAEETEPTQPVSIDKEQFIDEKVSIEQEADKPLITPVFSIDEIEQEKELEIEESIHVVHFEEGISDEESEIVEKISPETAEEQVVPPLNVEEQEQEVILEEEWDLEEIQPSDMPKTLRFAKYLLDQGEIDPAFEIFQTHISKPIHLDEIKTWVSDAINLEQKHASPLWEMLGDIAVKQDQPNEALSAYSKAISILLKKE